MVIVKEIHPLSYAKISVIMMTIFGFVMGIFTAIMEATVAPSAGPYGPAPGFGWWSILIFPVMYAVMGFVFGIIGAWLYNVVAGWVGGIEVEFDSPVATKKR